MGKSSLYGVNRGPDTKNKIHTPGASTQARFKRRLGLLYLWFDCRDNHVAHDTVKWEPDIVRHTWKTDIHKFVEIHNPPGGNGDHLCGQGGLNCCGRYGIRKLGWCKPNFGMQNIVYGNQ